MKQFEYKTLLFSHKTDLDKLGSEGWELCFIKNQSEAIFKREIEPRDGIRITEMKDIEKLVRFTHNKRREHLECPVIGENYKQLGITHTSMAAMLLFYIEEYFKNKFENHTQHTLEEKQEHVEKMVENEFVDLTGHMDISEKITVFRDISNQQEIGLEAIFNFFYVKLISFSVLSPICFKKILIHGVEYRIKKMSEENNGKVKLNLERI